MGILCELVPVKSLMLVQEVSDVLFLLEILFQEDINIELTPPVGSDSSSYTDMWPTWAPMISAPI